MNEIKTSGPAFPTTVRNHHDPETGGQWSEHIDQGMTLRDYFAAKAMQGYLSDSEWLAEVSPRGTAEAAYRVADAMIKARE
jgi:hypothetical protein